MEFLSQNKHSSDPQEEQQNKRVLGELDDFDQVVVLGDVMSSERLNVVVNNGVADRKNTANNNDSSVVANDNTVHLQTLQRKLTDRVTKEITNIGETVEDRIPNAVLTTMDHIITRTIELADRSMNASYGLAVASVTANCERGEQVENCALMGTYPIGLVLSAS